MYTPNVIYKYIHTYMVYIYIFIFSHALFDLSVYFVIKHLITINNDNVVCMCQQNTDIVHMYISMYIRAYIY